MVALAWLDVLWLALLIVGAHAAAFGWRGGAIVMLTGFVGGVLGHLVTGLAEYRRVMNRPWPKVSALEDDEDE